MKKIIIYILLILIVGVIMFFVIYNLNQNSIESSVTPEINIIDSQDDVVSNNDKTLENIPDQCGGNKFDAHVHYKESKEFTFIDELLNSNDVGCALITFDVDINDINKSLINIKNLLSNTTVQYYPILNIHAHSPSDITRGKILPILINDIVDFVGFGEISFYDFPWDGTSLMADPWPEIFDLLDEFDKILILHADYGQSEQLKYMLDKHPQTTVLLHGPELFDSLPELLSDYSNLYYSLDVASMLRNDSDPEYYLMYPTLGGASHFIGHYDNEHEIFLQQSLNRWKSLLISAPDKIMWGSDILLSWHYQQDVYGRIAEFSKNFVNQLPLDLQLQYLSKNAIRLFDGGLE